MNLPPLPLLVLDTETTGFVPRTHRVIEFACVRVSRKGGTTETYEQLFAVEDVPPVVQAITHIHQDDLQGRSKFAEKCKEILAHIGNEDLIVGQNITFDLGMLKGEGLDLTERPWIDTSILASLVFPELESYSLGYLSRVLNLPHEPAHRALGDVTATLALLEKCWERLLELPEELREIAKNVMSRGPKGYRMLFEELPKSRRKTVPKWLQWKDESGKMKVESKFSILNSQFSIPSKGTVQLVEESLDPNFLPSVMQTIGSNERRTTNDERRTWIAVKNLEATVKRLKVESPGTLTAIRILYPPLLLPDREAVARFASQESYTADEATLALKLVLYEPTVQTDFPLHGNGEDAVWNGKIACTETSEAYVKQFENLPDMILLDHRQLLAFLADPGHTAHGSTSLATGSSLHESDHIVIDNASMLEDTATKAYGWFVAIDDLRAAAEGDAALMKFLDLLQLWIEKVRQFQTIRYIAASDLRSPETHGLQKQLASIMESGVATKQLSRLLERLGKILDFKHLDNRITYLEQKQNGSQILHSVPERVGHILQKDLYTRFPTTLLIPQGSADVLPEILSHDTKTEKATTYHLKPITLPLSLEHPLRLEDILKHPPKGKTILLISSKGAIEDLFVKYEEALEEKGVTMICQGTSGGQGRMQAEFLVSPAPALWLMTPWTFEGIELPPASVDHLFVQTLPFDHPSHAVLSRRAEHYPDAFGNYMVPRLLHRLFRVLRTFSRFRTPHGDVAVLDERLRTKNYGPRVRDYLMQFMMKETDDAEDSGETKKSAEVQAIIPQQTITTTSSGRRKKSKTSEGQLALF